MTTAQEIESIVKKSKSNLAFALACLPRERRQDMHTFYAFCRVVDDLADDEDIPMSQRLAGLHRWQHLLSGAGAGEPSAFESEVMAVCQRHQIPHALMSEIVTGVSMDLEPLRFADWPALERYCYRVASCVGLVSIRIFGCHQSASEEYAVRLGHALQLTNILRDIGADWENGGRLYLPLSELAAAGGTEATIASGQPSPALTQVMEALIRRARAHYAAAAALVTAEDRLPLLASEAMRHIYSETLDLLEADGGRIFEKRYSLPKFRKAQLVANAWLKGLLGRWKS